MESAEAPKPNSAVMLGNMGSLLGASCVAQPDAMTTTNPTAKNPKFLTVIPPSVRHYWRLIITKF
jgi:hypothetical protein